MIGFKTCTWYRLKSPYIVFISKEYIYKYLTMYQVHNISCKVIIGMDVARRASWCNYQRAINSGGSYIWTTGTIMNCLFVVIYCTLRLLHLNHTSILDCLVPGQLHWCIEIEWNNCIAIFLNNRLYSFIVQS